MVHPWVYRKIRYYRNFQNEVWERDANNEVGNWVGKYEPILDRIDTAEEPKM